MLSTLRPLKRYRDEIDLHLLAPEIRKAWRSVSHTLHWGPFRSLKRCEAIRAIRATTVSLDGDAVSANLSPNADTTTLEALCRTVLPWRVGPYKLGELFIDSEWRSSMKWGRISPLLGPVAEKRIADVGCSNGYFLFKLSHQKPQLALGFDPIDRCWLQFSILQSMIRSPHIGFVPAGITSLDAFPNFFDLMLCMGVIYHQRDPFLACKKLFHALKPGGRVVLESLVIDTPGSHLLIPEERYAKMRNAWIIPTADALAALLKRAGFKNTEIHRFGPLTTAEQRRTDWARFESLADFLDPNDPSKTIEGYPAPHTAAVVASKP
jgi:tRNA (mo5U34)-methyltransferase